MRFALLMLGLILSMAASAGHLGVYGRTWEIVEPDMLEEIMSKLKKMEQSGELAKIEEAAKTKAVDSIRNPKPIAGITRAAKHRKWTWDPSVIVNEDILGPDGSVLIPAGYVLNPLDHQSWGRRVMLFIDGRDPRQVDFAKKRVQSNDMTRVILVAGSWLDISNDWQRQVFFDQGGDLVSRLGIQHVPATVRQSGRVLEIEELARF